MIFKVHRGLSSTVERFSLAPTSKTSRKGREGNWHWLGMTDPSRKSDFRLVLISEPCLAAAGKRPFYVFPEWFWKLRPEEPEKPAVSAATISLGCKRLNHV